MRNLITPGLLAAALLAGSAAQAQTVAVSGGAGLGQLWDDETRLGRGLVVAGGLSTMVRDRLQVGGTVDWLSHERTLTYLGVDGDAIGVLGRASYVFGPPQASVRPIAGGGLGMLHSTGTLRTPALGAPPGPTVPMTATDWSLTRALWEAHGGLRIAAGPRLTVQPEMRWRSTFGSGGVKPGSIEPPLLGVQGLVLVEWRVR